MEVRAIKQKLPDLIESIQSCGEPVILMIALVHGNTKNAKEEYKTSCFTNEMIQFIHILKRQEYIQEVYA